MKNLTKFILALLAGTLLFSSCQKEGEEITPSGPITGIYQYDLVMNQATLDVFTVTVSVIDPNGTEAIGLITDTVYHFLEDAVATPSQCGVLFMFTPKVQHSSASISIHGERKVVAERQSGMVDALFDSFDEKLDPDATLEPFSYQLTGAIDENGKISKPDLPFSVEEE